MEFVWLQDNARCVQKLNIFISIFHYFYRQRQNKSCNKIKFTDILFHFPLQQQLLEYIIKADFNVDIFITC